jgi:hypothetical protein
VARLTPIWPGTPEPEPDDDRVTRDEIAEMLADALAQPAPTMEIELKRRGASGSMQISRFDSGISAEQAQVLARGLLAGKDFTEDAWTGSGNPLSRGQFKVVRARMIDEGLAEWVDDGAHAQGVNITEDGWQALETMAGNGTTPPRSDRPTLA